MLTRNFALAGALAATLVAAFLPTKAVSADPGMWLPDIRLSDQITGPVLAEGHLLDRAGLPSPGRVTAIAWPRTDVLGALAIGGSVKTAPVAKALAGQDGAFALRIDPSVPIQQFMEDNGTINLSLRGEANGSKTVFDFSRRLDRSLATWVDATWSPDRGPARLLDVTLTLDRPAGAPANAVPVPAYKDGMCPNAVIDTYNDQWHTNGEVYPGPNATGQFNYIVGSSATLGVGYSVNGTYGSFSQSGTLTTSSSVTTTYPQAFANQYQVTETSWQYKKFAIYNWYEFYGCLLDYYSVRPTAYWAGSRVHYIGGPPFSPQGCAPQTAGVTQTKDMAAAVTFTNGVDLQAAIGLSVSSQTGFNQQTKTTYTFGPPGSLCGDTPDGWVSSGRVAGL
jgi:hypothetical protein